MKIMLLLIMIGPFVLSGCGSPTVEGPKGIQIASTSVNGLNVALSNSKGYLSEGPNEFVLDLRNQQGKAVEMGAITLFFDMPAMGSMPYMKSEASLTTTSAPGIYRGTVNLEMKGTWQSKLSYQGPDGSGEVEFIINAR